MIIIVFVLCFVFHDYLGWTVSSERFSSIYAFNYVLVEFSLFLITPDYLIQYFLWPCSGETTTNLDGSTLAKPSFFFHFFQITKPLNSSILSSFSQAVQFQSSPKFLCRNCIIRSNVASFPSNLITSLILFNWPTVPLPYSITLRTLGEYNLPFA